MSATILAVATADWVGGLVLIAVALIGLLISDRTTRL